MTKPFDSRPPGMRLLVIAGAAIVAACSGERPAADAAGAAQATQAAPPADTSLLLVAARVALPPLGLDASELPNPGAPGAALLQRYCVACHAMPSPQLHSATDWPGVLRRMWLRMDRVPASYSVPIPEAGQRLILQQYILDNALRVSGANLPQGRWREVYAATCSRCHDLPDPRQHSSTDWLAVVTRMSRRVSQMLGDSLPQVDQTRILLYLEDASRPK